MNYISLPQFGISVKEANTRKTVILFMNELIKRIPFVCDRIFSYMEQEYLPNNKDAFRHVVARDKARLKVADSVLITIAQLENEWYFDTHKSPTDYARGTLARIEEALGGLQILALFESNEKIAKDNVINGHVYRNLTPDQVREMTR